MTGKQRSAFSPRGSGMLESRRDSHSSAPPSVPHGGGHVEHGRPCRDANRHILGLTPPRHYLGMGSFQSPLLFGFFALENSFARTLPNKPNRTCSHLSAPPAGLSPPKHSEPLSPLGTTGFGDREDWSEIFWLSHPNVCFWSPASSFFSRGSGNGLLPGDPVSSSGSNLRNNSFPWT